VPLFALLDGIKIYVYYDEHLPPHIHAKYVEHEVLIDIRELTVYVGEFPSKPLKKVIALVKKKQKELLELFYEYNPELRP
jgi:Domain of unknown function (DUF4160)